MASAPERGTLINAGLVARREGPIDARSVLKHRTKKLAIGFTANRFLRTTHADQSEDLIKATRINEGEFKLRDFEVIAISRRDVAKTIRGRTETRLPAAKSITTTNELIGSVDTFHAIMRRASDEEPDFSRISYSRQSMPHCVFAGAKGEAKIHDA